MPFVRTFIGVGSNIEPETNIRRAAAALSRHAELVAASTFYRTSAIDRPDQSDFLNGVFEIRSGNDPLDLKHCVLRPIEDRLGRVRGGDRYAARTIDLDILIHGNTVLNCEDLVIPDPDIRTRAFVAVPLLELCPDLVLPGTGEALRDLSIVKQKHELIEVPEFSESVLARELK